MDWASSGLAEFFGGTAILELFMDSIVLLSRFIEQVFKGFYLLGKSLKYVGDYLVVFKNQFMETFQTLFSWFYLKAQQYNPFASDQDVRSADASYQYSFKTIEESNFAETALGDFKDMLIREGRILGRKHY